MLGNNSHTDMDVGTTSEGEQLHLISTTLFTL